MSDTFDADNFLSKCGFFSKKANESCAHVYDLYLFNLINSIKNYINRLSRNTISVATRGCTPEPL